MNQNVLAHIGRVLIALMFFISSIVKLLNLEKELVLFSTVPEILIIILIFIELILSILLMLNIRLKIVVTLLILYLIGNTFSAEIKYTDIYIKIEIMKKNLALIGAMILLLHDVFVKRKDL